MEWISVKDKMPEGKKLVIVEGGVAYYWPEFLGWYTVTCFSYPGMRIQWDVTHWMPLPEPPNHPQP